ncbi:homeobox protein BEL1 homolog [Salvia splendens]|uniref:homeobox protein BEL1 homolog n=1 Tax=Salvia splendens TaxID=180675 RepID=UPI001C276BA7|nr:homeobox protein BEL1 homolog [Salvia splendens]XP_042039895.1 homeobox protein BEL1 homolog [Salvia splendens]XP_042039896.1 homeobox protein BEL1 homolog [Salvia splendens]
MAGTSGEEKLFSSAANHQNILVLEDMYSLAGLSNETMMISPDDPCVFSCEGNERPSQGFSLSLSSSNPSSIGLQAFELRFGPSSSRSVNFEQPYSHPLNNSKYLSPAQELLSEFCNLEINQHQMKPPKSDDEKKSAPTPSFSLDLLELHTRKTKLLQMLDEVDRRYKHYCDKMKCVTSSFEAAAGGGAAAPYSTLASKAMSRHFRSLRDEIVKEIKATKKGMGEKEGVKGETPRLRLLDQMLRQQKALQQMSMIENHPWRPQRGLPERSVSVLRAWLFEHFLHPYPTDVDKHILARQTGLSRSQVSNWFINARVRLWKPMVEEMYLEELKEKDGGSRTPDQKPSHDQLMRMDSECLSSIINNNNDDKEKSKLQNHFGAMELNFSSYSGGGGGDGVSLTLGLQQRGGVGLAFYPRDQMEECQTTPFSLLDGENQSFQYRNLMGAQAQMLHDLAG